jgi:hypothetical protein
MEELIYLFKDQFKQVVRWEKSGQGGARVAGRFN